MNELIDLWEIPKAEEKHMIVGWHQWADAGAISSAFPRYLINKTGAEKIGEIKQNGFYLFQIPGTHHLMRPEIKLDEGYRRSLTKKKNELFYTGDEQKGLVIFLGDEPHLDVEGYATAFFDAVESLQVKRVAAVAGVYGVMPFDKDRDVSCVYSLPRMKAELAEYAVRFSDYEGGATIGSYLLDEAEQRGIEFCVFYAFVPAYDLSQQSDQLQGLRIEHDFKAWYDLMRRLNHMFTLRFDLSELEQQSQELIASMEAKIDEIERALPQLNVRSYLDQVSRDFTERTFEPLSDVWEEELGDLLKDLDDSP